MIIVRNVFQLKFGKAREALAIMKEGVAIQKRLAAEGSALLLTDVTGRHYTLILEMTLPNLAALEAMVHGSSATRSFRRCRWWSPDTARFSPSLSRSPQADRVACRAGRRLYRLPKWRRLLNGVDFRARIARCRFAEGMDPGIARRVTSSWPNGR